MPGRNVNKIDTENSYYHIYGRGAGRQKIFRDDSDYLIFLDLFKRHLSNNQSSDKFGRVYTHLHGQVELLCYCLMNNHFHLLIYQDRKGAMTQLMHSVMTSYSIYFNKKYHKSGPLLESRYKASMIIKSDYLMLISRYIHLVPGNWQAYPYSSIHAYFGIGQTEWLQPSRITKLFGSTPIYADFLDDIKGYKISLNGIKQELANSIS